MTILDMFKELNSFVPCSKYFDQASKSKITTENDDEFDWLVKDWTHGVYDEDLMTLVCELLNLIEK